MSQSLWSRGPQGLTQAVAQEEVAEPQGLGAREQFWSLRGKGAAQHP